MRVGDIRTLKLDQIHWEDSTIKVTQSKTGLPLSLPLTNEVGEALIDYLKSGRPQTTHREVFLKVKPPFDPFTGNNLHHIVTYWRLLAGIRFRSPHKRGMNCLRHTLANSASAEGNTVDDDRRDLRPHEFGINAHLREGRCGNLAERGVGSGGESCRMMHPARTSRAFWLFSWINFLRKSTH